MRRLRAARDRGAVTALVAILFSTGVIIAMLALVVDVGSMMWERRQLQNGADAATLALAQDCASKRATCDPATPGLKWLADANAADGFGGIQRVCAVGTFVGADKFTGCTATTGALTDCLPTPAGATGPYVEVRTRTSTNSDDTGTILKPFFAQAVGWDGATIAACSRVGWSGGHPSTVLPVVQSQCAWDDATAKGKDFPAAPPYALDGSGVAGKTPLPALPVASGYVTKVEGKGSNTDYTIDGVSAFYLAGYSVTGNKQLDGFKGVDASRSCDKNEDCLYGWFVSPVIPVDAIPNTGTDRGPQRLSTIG
ncbi:TadE/TadG family type IV pilus assembly protein [Terrabacter sp. C0L_2]|uniref:TadE/TadG family type IV pilus assembly protein n=1 Tax=Terrabacter sp. C0L_2 TaxID=3108389 RepID=UPI002ED4A33D|nr:TadE/TadG family type IV pilus assembly protein [Terrabacter sp. C0L_2]